MIRGVHFKHFTPSMTINRHSWTVGLYLLFCFSPPPPSPSDQIAPSIVFTSRSTPVVQLESRLNDGAATATGWPPQPPPLGTAGWMRRPLSLWAPPSSWCSAPSTGAWDSAAVWTEITTSDVRRTSFATSTVNALPNSRVTSAYVTSSTFIRVSEISCLTWRLHTGASKVCN